MTVRLASRGRVAPTMRRVLLWLMLAATACLALLLLASRGDDAPGDGVRPRGEGGAATRRETPEMRGAPAQAVRQESASPAVESAAPVSTAIPLAGDPNAEGAPHGEVQALLRVVVVRVETGVPLSRCKVVVWELDDPEGYAVSEDEGIVYETDDRGGVDAAAPAGRWLLVAAGGLRPSLEGALSRVPEDEPLAQHEKVAPLDAGAVHRLRFELVVGRDATFHARLVAADGGEPIEGARIGPIERPWRMPAELLRPTTSATGGLFTIPCSSWRDPVVWRIEADGYGPALLSPQLGSESPDDALALELRRSASLRATVRGMEGLALVLGASTVSYQISVPKDAPVFGEDPEWRAELDASGACTLEGLPALAALSVWLQKGNEVVRPWTGKLVLEPGEVRTLEWELRAEATILGRLFDQDVRAIPDTEVWLASEINSWDEASGAGWFHAGEEENVVQRTNTDADGGFCFSGVPPGTWWVGPAAPRHEWQREAEPESDVAPQARRVVIDAGRHERRVDLTAARGLFLRGTVLGPDGTPEADAFVMAYSGGPPVTGGSVSTAADGTFALGPLAYGEYQVGASGGNELGDSDYVLARAGSADVVLRLKRAGSLAGIVVDATTGSRSEASLWIHMPAAEMLTAVGVSTDVAGRFRVDGLVPGTYDLAASRPDGLAGVMKGVHVAAGTVRDGLRIELIPGARLEIRCSGPSAFASFSIFSEGSFVVGDGIESGTFTTCTVPAGELRIEARMQQKTEERVITAAAGERVEVLFEFP